jgi:hypothetical protein
MATRGQIAYLANPNTIFTTYIHYDAYPQALGKTLTTYFNSDNEAEDIVMNGNSIRSIDDEGTIDRFEDGRVKQIKGTEPEELFNELYSHSDVVSANYVYIWIEDKWITLDMNKGREYFVGTLLDSIRKIEPTMNESYTDATNNELASYIGTLQNEIGNEENPEKLAMLKQDLEDVKLELEKRKPMNESQDNEYFIHRMKYRAGIIK